MHELADKLVVLDRGEVVSVIARGQMSLAELTRYLIELQGAREGARVSAAAGWAGSRGCRSSACAWC